MEKVDTRNKRMIVLPEGCSVETACSVSMLTGVTGTGIGFTAAARKAGPTATTARKIGTAASGLKNAKKVMDL
mgnify:CR=1 FL=1